SQRAAKLISEIAGGEISKGLYDEFPEKFEQIETGVRISKANELIGIELNRDEIIRLLEKIDIKFTGESDDKLNFKIPEFRREDISRESDLIEEIARLYGYDNIPAKYNFNVNTENSSLIDEKSYRLMKFISEYFVGRGFNQILTSPLSEGKEISNNTDIPEKPIKLENTVSAEMNTLRSGLLSGMLGVIRNNFNNNGKNISLKLFEAGNVFTHTESKFSEEQKLILAISGKNDESALYGGDKNFDIFDMKGETEMFLSKLNLDKLGLFYYYDNDISRNRIDISLNKNNIGFIYKADSKLKKEFEIDSDVYIAEFCLNKILKYFLKTVLYKEISKFPKVKRDLAVIVKSETPFKDVSEQILNSGKGLLEKLELFDIYTGDKIEKGNKSLAFSMEFSSEEKTLTDKEISFTMDKIITDLKKKLNAEIRS
ncbi:MAG: hypothetical protein WAT71_17715, partial [Ignavibacteria bacterium]